MSAADKSLNGISKSAESATSSIVKIASGIGAIKVLTAGIDMIKNSVGDAVSRIDTLNNSSRVFKNMGFSAEDTKSAMDKLTQSIQGMPTALNDGVQGVQMLASSTGDLGKSTDIFAALNDGILGFGGSTDQVSGAIRQLSQAFAGGKVDAETWNSMLDSGLGPALNAIAKQMGITTADLKAGLSDSSISVGTFQDALIDLDKNGGGGLASLHQIALDALGGISTSMANAKTAVTRGVADIINAIDAGLAANNMPGIAASISAAGSIMEKALKSVASVIPGVITKITSFGKTLIPWAPIMKAAGAAVAVLVGAIMASGQIVSTITMFKQFSKAVSGLMAVMSANPFILVIAAAGLLAVALMSVAKGSDTLKNGLTQIGKGFTSAFSGAGNAMETVRQALLNIVNGVKTMTSSFVEAGGAAAIFHALATVANLVGKAINFVITGISKLISAFTGVSTGNQTFTSLGQAAAGIAKGIDKSVTAMASFVASVKASKTAQAIFKTIKDIVTAAGDAFRSLPQSVKSAITAFAGLAAGGILLRGMFGGVTGLLGKFIGGAKNVSGVSEGAAAGTGIFKTALGGLGGGIQSILGKIPSFLSGFKGMATTIGGSVIGSFSKLVSAMGPVGAKIGEVASRTPVGAKAMTVLGSSTKLLGPIFSALSGPIGIAIALIGGIGAVVSASGSHFDAISAKIQQFGNNFAKIGPVIGKAMGQVVQAIATGIAAALPAIATGFMQLALSIAMNAPKLGAAMGIAIGGLLTGIAAAVPGIVAGFTVLATAIASQIPTIVASLTLLFVSFVGAITVAIPQIVASLTQLFVAFVAAVTANLPTIVASVTTLIATFLNTLAANIGQIIDAGANLITQFLIGIAQALPQIMPAAIQVIVAFINGLAQEIGPIVQAGMQLIINFLEGIAQKIPSLVTAAVDVIVAFIEGIANNLGKIIDAAVDLIGKFILGLINAIPKITAYAVQAVEKFVYGVGNALGQVLASGGKLIKMFIQGVMDGLSGSKNAGKSNADGAKGGISGVKLLSVGKDLIQGFIDGMGSMVKGVISKAASIASSALDAIKSKLKIGSPSKVMKRYGVWTGMGFVNGIDEMLKPVDRMSTRLAAAAVPDVGAVDFTPTFDTNSLNTKLQKASAMLNSNLGSTVNSSMQLNNNLTVEVPVNIDGTRVAKVTAKPMQTELNRMQSRTDRLNGIR